MPGKKGTMRAPDGSFQPTEEAKRLWAESSQPEKRKTAKKALQEGEVVASKIQSIEDPTVFHKGSDNSKLPRIMITEFDEKGRMKTMTFVCDPKSLQVRKDENVTYTTGGRSKRTLYIAIESNVVEVE